MSNEELIRKFYDAFKNKDIEVIDQLCDEKIEWNTLKGMPYGTLFPNSARHNINQNKSSI